MSRDRSVNQDHNTHLGSDGRTPGDQPYTPKRTHQEIDQTLDTLVSAVTTLPAATGIFPNGIHVREANSNKVIDPATSSQTLSIAVGDTTANGYVLDQNGLRFYAAGVQTVNLDATGGNATFTGTISGSVIKTATAGTRIVIDGSTGVQDRLQFFSGESGELGPGMFIVVPINSGLASRAAELLIGSPWFTGGVPATISLTSRAADGSSPTTVRSSATQIQMAPGSATYTLNVEESADGGHHVSLHSGPTQLKFLNSTAMVQVRNDIDTLYAPIKASKFLASAPATISGHVSTGTLGDLQLVVAQLIDALNTAAGLGLVIDSTT